MESDKFNFKSLVDLIKNHLLVFVVVAILAAIVGWVISMPVFMTPLFKSVAVVYPINIEPLSDESETEQLLQYFEATSIRDSLIIKFDLFQRYGIDPEAKSANYKLYLMYNDRVVVSKTLYESIRLEVSDEDPVVAKDMADEILKQLNLKYNQLTNEWGVSRAESFAQQMAFQRSSIDSIEAAVSRLSVDNRLLSYEDQSRELVRGYIQMAEKNDKNSDGFKDLESMIKGAQEKGSTIKMLQNISYFAASRLAILEEEYLTWREKGYGTVECIQVVVNPEVSDKKSWPIRWLVLVVSVVSALLFTVVVMALLKAGRSS